MATIKNQAGEVESELVVLMHYFGRHRHQNQSISDFNEECKKLTPEAKTELVHLAAKELGWTVEV